MNIQFKRLTEVKSEKIIELMNHPLVRRQMPLLKGRFDENDCHRFVKAKEQLWIKYGYGPWAFIINGEFAGWGGLQQENEEVDLAMVLHPHFWGVGKSLYTRILNYAFNEMKLTSLTILLPPSRERIKGILRLGFMEDGELAIGKEQFIRYRLTNQ